MQKHSIFFLALILLFASIFVIVYCLPLAHHKRYFSVTELGSLKVGERPVNDYGYRIFFPEYTFPGPEPRFKFYISLFDDTSGLCLYEGCGKYGAFVETMGGWLLGGGTRQSEPYENLGLRKTDQVNPIRSLIIVSDENLMIVGLYPNATADDLISILRRHPDLADFTLLEGVVEFGPLKVGAPGPLQSGDSIYYRPIHAYDFELSTVPRDKKFYIYAIQKRFLTKGKHCTYLTCDYIMDSYVEPAGGWLFSDGEEKTARLFGLDPKKVREGKESLVPL